MPLENLQTSDRIDNFESWVEKKRATFDKNNLLAFDLTNNKLCRNEATRGSIRVQVEWYSCDVILYLYDYDLPTVIEHVAGPFHLLHNIDWHLSIPWDDQLLLETRVNSTNVKIYLQEGEMSSCKILRVVKRTKTIDEINREIEAARDPHEYELRIDCAGGE